MLRFLLINRLANFGCWEKTPSYRQYVLQRGLHFFSSRLTDSYVKYPRLKINIPDIPVYQIKIPSQTQRFLVSNMQ